MEQEVMFYVGGAVLAWSGILFALFLLIFVPFSFLIHQMILMLKIQRQVIETKIRKVRKEKI